MTSGISFPKLVAQNARERKWLPFLITVTGIFALVIGYYFVLGDAVRGGIEGSAGYYDRIAYMAESYLGTRSAFLVTLALIAALLSGYSGYLWLHAQEQVDFYNSTAVKRGRLFSAIFASGALQVLVPFVLCDLAAVFLMPAAQGVFSWRLVGIGLRGMAFAILVFLCLYSFVVLSAVLSARTMTTVLMTALFWLYGPLLYWLLEALRQQFFDTLVNGTSDTVFFWLSPAFLAYGAAGEVLSHAGSCLGILIYGAAAFAAGLAAYSVRPSEAAGSAFPFKRETTVIKCMIMVPSSLGIGMILGGIAGQNGPSVYYTNSPGSAVYYSSGSAISAPWMAFGLLFGAFLMHTVLELLFQPDFRNIRRHWKSGGVGAAISLAVYLFLVFDPMRVNLWIPDKTDVQAMSVNSDIANPWFAENSYAYYDDEQSGTGEFFREYGALYDLAQTCVESRASEDRQMAADTGEMEKTVIIGYLLGDGRKAYRKYTVSTDRLYRVAEKMSESEEYRKNYYMTAQLPADFTDASVTAWDPESSTAPVSLSLNAGQRQALVDALAQDSTSQTLTQLLDQTPLCTLELSGVSKNSGHESYSQYYSHTIYIYPSYKTTLAQLEAQGLNPETKFHTSPAPYPTGMELYFGDGTEDNSLSLSDPDAIREMLLVLKRETQAQADRSTGTDVSVWMTYSDSSNQSFLFSLTSETTFRELFRKYKDQTAALPAMTKD